MFCFFGCYECTVAVFIHIVTIGDQLNELCSFSGSLPVLIAFRKYAPNDSTCVGLRMARAEFCQNEEFQARCGSSAVVVVTSARYGRMSVGRCVRRDYGFVGCGSDVLGITDRLCSGRRNCTVRVPNSWYDDAAQRARCPEDFKNYLRISYDCLDGQWSRHPQYTIYIRRWLQLRFDCDSKTVRQPFA